MQRLQGKVALVTGSSRGIGAAIARRLAADGARVAVNYARGLDAAAQVVIAIKKAGGEAVALAADLSVPEQAERLVAEAAKAFGQLDILVNNAGLYDVKPLDAADATHVRRLFELNVFGLLAASRAALPHLSGRGGRIINISSVVARGSLPANTAYSATKAAVEAITRCLAAELGPKQITVNAVAPGTTATDMLMGGTTEAIRKNMVTATPLRRMGEPDDIADVVAFLASDEARWVTGQVIDASGGLRV
jgi:3-oxoacyl-[acyl-carrier protein] reductase